MTTVNPNRLLSPTFLMGALKSRPESYTRQGYIGRKFFKEQYVPTWELTWDVVSAENQLAGIISRGGKPVPGDDMLYTQMFANLVALGAMRVVDRNAVKVVRDPGMANVTTKAARDAAQRAAKKIREALAWCDDRIEALVEYMCVNAMQGQITWPPPNVPESEWEPQWGDVTFSITFPFRSNFKQQASTLVGYDGRTGTQVPWTDPANSNPIKDLEVIAELITETTGLNARGATIITSSGVISRLTENQVFLNRIAGTDRGIQFLNVGDLKNFITDNLGFKIVQYDAQWTYRRNVDSDTGPEIVVQRFLPRGRLIIIPPGEELGFLATTEQAGPDGKYYTGKFVWQNEDKEPPFDVRLGVSAVYWPVLTRADSIFVFDAWD